MNIFALKNQIEFYLDQVKAPRFRDKQLAGAINAACRFIIEKAFPSDVTRKETSEFERGLGSWSKFGVLIEHTPLASEITDHTTGVVTIVNNLITRASMPVDFMIFIGAEVWFGTSHYPAIAIPHSKALVVERDPFERASMAYPQRIFIKEDADGLHIITGDAAIATQAKVEYLKIPAMVFFGTDIVNNATIDPDTLEITGSAITLSSLISGSLIKVFCKTPCTFFTEEVLGRATATATIDPDTKVITGDAIYISSLVDAMELEITCVNECVIYIEEEPGSGTIETLPADTVRTLSGMYRLISGTITYHDPESSIPSSFVENYQAETLRNFLSNSKLISGTIAVGFVECSFPESLFDEVARVSSAILSGTLKDLASKQDLFAQPKM